jgi:hypothetical protein
MLQEITEIISSLDPVPGQLVKNGAEVKDYETGVVSHSPVTYDFSELLTWSASGREPVYNNMKYVAQDRVAFLPKRCIPITLDGDERLVIHGAVYSIILLADYDDDSAWILNLRRIVGEQANRTDTFYYRETLQCEDSSENGPS